MATPGDDKGWRIDYLLCNPTAAEQFVAVDIVEQAGLEVGDHAPCILDLMIEKYLRDVSIPDL